MAASGRVSRRALLLGLWSLAPMPAPILVSRSHAQEAVLPSWNKGPAREAIIDFVRTITDRASPSYTRPEDRIATFDQDGTLWVEHPVYTQAMFALDRLRVLAPRHPEWKHKQPFKSVIAGDLNQS